MRDPVAAHPVIDGKMTGGGTTFNGNMSDVEDVFVGAVASVVAVAVAAVTLVAIVDVIVVVWIGRYETEPNNNLQLVVIVVTDDDVDEAWEEPPSGSVATTTASAVDAIYTSLLFEEVPSTARPLPSRSKAGKMSASPGTCLFLLAAAAG